jgi:drug/metabolite transporter (DMT)-like permease
MGLFDAKIYGDLADAGRLPPLMLLGSQTQDMIFIPLAVLLAVCAVIFLRRPGVKLLTAMLGFIANFFYGYALYTMQGAYTSIYLVYLAIFSLTIYTLIFGFLCFSPEAENGLQLSQRIRVAVTVFLYAIVFILGVVWLLRISADIAKHLPGDTYGVFVLDLGVVFPALAVAATRLVRQMKFGLLLAGVVLMKVLTICLSWGFSEWYARFTGVIVGDYGMLAIPTVLTIVSGFFFALYMTRLKNKTA